MTLEELQAQVAELTSKLEKSEADKKAMGADLMKYKAKAKGAEIDPEEYAKLQARVEELTEAKEKADKSAKTEVEKLTKALAEKDGALTQHLIDAGLTDALAKAGVAPHYLTAAKAMFKGQAVLKAEGAEYKALIGDKPISDAITAWAATDEGKHFVAAPANSGGGAPGGGGKSVNHGDKLPDLTDKAGRAAFYAARLAKAEE